MILILVELAGCAKPASRASTDNTANASTYQIVLRRPVKVGATYSIHANGDLHRVLNVKVANQPDAKTETWFKVELDGLVKVLAVDDGSGKSTSVQCTIDRFTNQGKLVLKPGSVVTAENASVDTAYSINGAPVEEDVKTALRLVITCPRPGGPSDDQTFGTATRQPVGGTWPVNLDLYVTEAVRQSWPLTRDGVKGTVKLASVQQVNEKPALQLECDTAASNFSGPGSYGLQIQSGSMAVQYITLLPADNISRYLSETMHSKVTMRAEVKGDIVEGDDTMNSLITYGETKY